MRRDAERWSPGNSATAPELHPSFGRLYDVGRLLLTLRDTCTDRVRANTDRGERPMVVQRAACNRFCASYSVGLRDRPSEADTVEYLSWLDDNARLILLELVLPHGERGDWKSTMRPSATRTRGRRRSRLSIPAPRRGRRCGTTAAVRRVVELLSSAGRYLDGRCGAGRTPVTASRTGCHT